MVHELQVSRSVVWLTPRWVLDGLGVFDLDPCAAVGQPWRSALNHFTVVDDGLSREWFGRVWCNPPYGRAVVEPWLDRLSNHSGGGVALVFARVDTKWFKEFVWGRADAVFFFSRRLQFVPWGGTDVPVNRGDNASAPSCLVAYGAGEVEVLRSCGFDGVLVDSWHNS